MKKEFKELMTYFQIYLIIIKQILKSFIATKKNIIHQPNGKLREVCKNKCFILGKVGYKMGGRLNSEICLDIEFFQCRLYVFA